MENSAKSKLTLKDKAYDIIREKIADCVFMPNQFLDEEELMKLVGASRTPIREALNKLEQDGLISIMPKRGVMVNDINISSLNSIYEVRMLIEPYIVRKYGHLVPEKELRKEFEIFGTSKKSNNRDYSEDDKFHRLLISTSCNTYLINVMEQIYTQNQRLRILTAMRNEERIRDTGTEHRKIIQAMLDKDYEKAASAMEEHLNAAKKAIFDYMLSTGRQI